jgi:hypothetical protein
MGNDTDQLRPGFDPDLAGKLAECDGGGPVMGTKFAGRQEFTGTLTGKYMDHGDPPWRWYLMTDLTQRPENFDGDCVWCESDSIFLVDDPGRLLGPHAKKNVESAKQARQAKQAKRAEQAKRAREGER